MVWQRFFSGVGSVARASSQVAGGLLGAFVASACAAAPPNASGVHASTRPAEQDDIASVTRELDGLHRDAAAADETRYFAHFAKDAVFLGTDARERWDMRAFREFAHPHFAKGKGWTYKPVRRAVSFAADRSVAYFDEDLVSPHAGPTRGSGVLLREGDRYLLVQYNLSFTIPNERADEVRKIVAPTL